MVPPCRVHEDGGKEKLYAASLSGGKDSTAMVLRLVEEGWPLDFVMFCDCLLYTSDAADER